MLRRCLGCIALTMILALAATGRAQASDLDDLVSGTDFFVLSPKGVLRTNNGFAKDFDEGVLQRALAAAKTKTLALHVHLKCQNGTLVFRDIQCSGLQTAGTTKMHAVAADYVGTKATPESLRCLVKAMQKAYAVEYGT